MRSELRGLPHKAFSGLRGLAHAFSTQGACTCEGFRAYGACTCIQDSGGLHVRRLQDSLVLHMKRLQTQGACPCIQEVQRGMAASGGRQQAAARYCRLQCWPKCHAIQCGLLISLMPTSAQARNTESTCYVCCVSAYFSCQLRQGCPNTMMFECCSHGLVQTSACASHEMQTRTLKGNLGFIPLTYK